MEELPAILFLKEKNIPFEIQTFSQTTAKGILAISKVLGVAPEIVVKTLVFRGKFELLFAV
jgi:prolyl-tRNA editing enzyme YbaK/EbsC (Cys-tRNA(Pro) deacylase)